jgi:hypothetical protein
MQNRAILRFFLIGLLLSTIHSQLSTSQAAVVHASYSFSDFTTRPLNVKRVTVTPLAAGADYDGAQLSNKPLIYAVPTYYMLTNGSITISNLVVGYAYKVAFSDGFSEPAITNYFSTNITTGAVVDGNDYKTTYIQWANGVAVQIWFAYLSNTNSTGGTTYTNNTGLPGVVLGSGIGTNLSTVATQSGLAAGSYAINGALATNISELRPLFVALGGRTFSGLKSLGNTNVSGQLSTFTWTTASSSGTSLMITNAVIADAYFTNSASASDHVIIGATNAGYCFLKNVSVVGQNRAANLKADNSFILSIEDSTFRAPQAFETWRAVGSIKSSVFDSRTTAALASSDIAFLANDDAFLTIQGCSFYYGGSPEGYGYGGMARSKSVLSGCLFSCKGTATNATAISLFESDATVVLNNCLFLAATNFILTFADGGVRRDGVIAEFNNCFVGDYTSGLNVRLFANSNYIVRVSGGNFTREMFTTQSNVIFTAGDVQILTNTMALDVTYTNIPAATFGNVAWLGTTTLGGDIAQVDLLIDQDGNATWDSVISRFLFSGTTDLNGSLEFNFSLRPSARFRFSNSNSVGASIEFLSSQFSSK